MDTVGSNGVIICNDKERCRKYQFMLQIQLSKLKLTKIVTIMPYFLVVNNTHHQLRYMEEDESADLWVNLGPHEVNLYSSFDTIKVELMGWSHKITKLFFLFKETVDLCSYINA